MASPKSRFAQLPPMPMPMRNAANTPRLSTPKSFKTPRLSTPKSFKTPRLSTPKSFKTPRLSTPKSLTPRANAAVATPKDVTSNPKLSKLAKELDELVAEGDELRELREYQNNDDGDDAPNVGSITGRFLMRVVGFIAKNAGFVVLVLMLYKRDITGEKVSAMLGGISKSALVFFAMGIKKMLQRSILSAMVTMAAGAAQSVLYYPCFAVVYSVMRINKFIRREVQQDAASQGTPIPDSDTPPKPRPEATPRQQTPFNDRAERRANTMAKIAVAAISLALKMMSVPGGVVSGVISIGSFLFFKVNWAGWRGWRGKSGAKDRDKNMSGGGRQEVNPFQAVANTSMGVEARRTLNALLREQDRDMRRFSN